MESQDLLNFYYGEAVEFFILAKGPDGLALATPDDQTLIFTLGTGLNSTAILSLDDVFLLVDELTSKFQISIGAHLLAGLAENKTYYYNLWSKLNTDNPRLQCFGKFKLGPSIEIAQP